MLTAGRNRGKPRVPKPLVMLSLRHAIPCAVATILLAVLSLIDDKHRLRSERLQARASAAKGAVAWLAAQASQVGWLP